MKDYFLPEGDIYYRTNEHQPGRLTLFFIHGLSGSSSAWAPFEAALSADYNLVALDLRGHGLSYKPRAYEEYSAAAFATDIERVVSYLKLEPFVLISHSMGTLIAFEYLKKNQGKILANILLSPSANPNTGFGPQALKAILPIGRKLHLYRPAKERGGHIDYAKNPQKSDWDLRAVWQDVMNSSVGVYLYSTEQMLHTDYRDFLSEIHVPTIVIHGSDDSIFPFDQSQAVAHNIQGAELVTIPGADHIIVKNNVPEVLEAMRKFLSRLS